MPSKALDLRVFAARVGATAAAKGWDKPTWENLPGKLMLVVTEIVEAVDGVYTGKPEIGRRGRWPADELADITIRLLDALYTLWPRNGFNKELRSGRIPSLLHRYSRPVEQIWPLVRRLRTVTEHWRRGRREEVKRNLMWAIAIVYQLAAYQLVDLDAALLAKADINDKRPPLHGKKMTLG